MVLRSGRRWRLALLPAVMALVLVSLVLVSPMAVAQQPVDDLPPKVLRLPGIGQDDPRVRVDLAQAPWRSVGKLQITAGSVRTTCTGALVGPVTVLTAAHCLFNLRTQRYFLPSAMHFLIAYDRGQYAAHAGVQSFVVGAGYDPRKPAETRSSDWALLTIDTAPGDDRILPLIEGFPAPDTPVMIGGYSQDRSFTITVDMGCRIVRHVRGRTGDLLLRHDCTATRGASGAPVLVRGEAGWRIGGVNVAAIKGETGGLATAVGEARAALDHRQ